MLALVSPLTCFCPDRRVYALSSSSWCALESLPVLKGCGRFPGNSVNHLWSLVEPGDARSTENGTSESRAASRARDVAMGAVAHIAETASVPTSAVVAVAGASTASALVSATSTADMTCWSTAVVAKLADAMFAGVSVKCP